MLSSASFGACRPTSRTTVLALLGEAYGLLGGLDAVLYRAWLRNLMRGHGVPVDRRGERAPAGHC